MKTAKLIISVVRKGAKMMTLATRIILCSIFIMLCLLVGCSDQEDEEFSFIATVLENNQTSLLVEPAEGSIELSSSDRIVAHLSDAIITDPQGNKVDITAIVVGDKVMIIYSGEIAESYPAQIWSFRVQLMD
jgi:hypothetical protein